MTQFTAYERTAWSHPIAQKVECPLFRWVIVTQKTVGQNTDSIQTNAPKTWRYLNRHAALLDARRSRIYRKRPRFSVFGVGDYTFAPWKVGVCSLYKKLAFRTVGKHAGKPVVLDDTSYFLPCYSRAEAELVARLLNSDVAKDFFSAFIFWDAKRPITVQILGQLSLLSLASELGCGRVMHELLSLRSGATTGFLFP